MTPRDVIESLLFKHSESRHMLSLAESLESGSATTSTAEAAARVEAFLTVDLPRHLADEEQSLAPRLSGRHVVVDRALETIRSEHFREAASAARLATLCGVVRRDPSMLHSVRFALGRAVAELKALVLEHQELEEAIVFPALRRLLPPSALAEIDAEVHARWV